jgi:hypothetical protein
MAKKKSAKKSKTASKKNVKSKAKPAAKKSVKKTARKPAKKQVVKKSGPIVSVPAMGMGHLESGHSDSPV